MARKLRYGRPSACWRRWLCRHRRGSRSCRVGRPTVRLPLYIRLHRMSATVSLSITVRVSIGRGIVGVIEALGGGVVVGWWGVGG